MENKILAKKEKSSKVVGKNQILSKFITRSVILIII